MNTLLQMTTKFRPPRTLLTLAAASLMTACSVLPLKSEISEGHARVENYYFDDGDRKETIRLMCFNNRLNDSNITRQLPAGNHELWVSAFIEKNRIQTSDKQAYTQLSVRLEEGKEYTLNRKISDSDISFWIQEITTGQRVSDVVKTGLTSALYNDESKRHALCRDSAV